MILAIGLFIFLLAKPIDSQILTVKLIENTNYCETDCYSIYEICADKKPVISDSNFIFTKDSKNFLTYDKILTTKPKIEITKKDSCYNLRIDGKKKLFDNVDNVLCLENKCYYEYAWWNTTYKYRYRILSNITFTDFQFNVNDTYFPNIWTNNKSVMYMYCDLINCSNLIAIGNETEQLNWENGNTRDGYNPKSVWSNMFMVLHLDEGTGLVAYDSTNNGHSGSLVNSPTWNNTCIYGNCTDFHPATIDAITISDVNLTMDNNFSIAINFMNIQSNPTGVYRHLISNGDGSAHSSLGFGMLMHGDYEGKLSCEYEKIPTGSMYRRISTLPLNHSNYLNKWTDVICVFIDGNIKMYINGIEDTGTTSGTPSATMNNPNSPLYIGRENRVNGLLSWNGTIDDVWLINGVVDSKFALDFHNNRINNLTKFNVSEILPSINFQFNILDSYTNVHLPDIIITCNNFTLTGNSPVYKEFTVLTETYNCNASATFYFNKSFSFNVSDNFKNISLDRIGLTQQEHQWLKTSYLLQNVQGIEIYPNNFTCIDNMTLKKEYIQEICLDNSCNNITLRQINIPCPFGCGIQLSKYGDDCLMPSYQIDIFIILIFLCVIIIGVYLNKKR